MVSIGTVESLNNVVLVSQTQKEMNARKVNLDSSVYEILYGSKQAYMTHIFVRRMIRANMRATNKFVALLSDALYSYGLHATKFPLVKSYKVEEENLVIEYYTNIYLVSSLGISGKSVNKDSIVFIPVMASMEEDLKDPQRIKKWENASRIRSTISTLTESTLGKLLTNIPFVNSSNAEIPLLSHTIRDISDAIKIQLSPAKLVMCESPEDYITMYTNSPGSCMTGNNRTWVKRLGNKFHPTIFYHYWPKTQGAFLVKGDRVLARVICSGIKEGKPTSFGNIYARTTADKENLASQLRAAGMRNGGLCSGDNKRKSFVVPGIKYDDYNYVAGFPYIDGRGSSFYVKYNPRKKEFTFLEGSPHGRPKGYIPIGSVVNNRMILSSKVNITMVTCTVCKCKVPVTEALTTNDGKKHFCSRRCLTNSGTYGYVVDIYGGMNIVRCTGIEIQSNDCHKFANINAIRNSFMLPNESYTQSPPKKSIRDLIIASELPGPTYWIALNSSSAFLHSAYYRQTSEDKKRFIATWKNALSSYPYMPLYLMAEIPPSFGCNFRGLSSIPIIVPIEKVLRDPDTFWELVQFLPTEGFRTNGDGKMYNKSLPLVKQYIGYNDEFLTCRDMDHNSPHSTVIIPKLDGRVIEWLFK